jgi:hypothetical protein
MLFFYSEILRNNSKPDLQGKKGTDAISDAMIGWHNRLYGTTTRVPSITKNFYLRRF